MPTYDYRCTKCQRSIAVEQSMLDKPLKKCKTCGGKLEKMLPKSVNLIFKGSGFYVTDYRKGPGRAGESKDDHGSKSNESQGKSNESQGKSKTSGKSSIPEKSATTEKGGGA